MWGMCSWWTCCRWLTRCTNSRTARTLPLYLRCHSCQWNLPLKWTHAGSVSTMFGLIRIHFLSACCQNCCRTPSMTTHPGSRLRSWQTDRQTDASARRPTETLPWRRDTLVELWQTVQAAHSFSVTLLMLLYKLTQNKKLPQAPVSCGLSEHAEGNRVSEKRIQHGFVFICSNTLLTCDLVSRRMKLCDVKNLPQDGLMFLRCIHNRVVVNVGG